MTILFQDNFNRADNPVVDAVMWTENAAGDWSIVSNKLRSVNPITSLITTAAAHADIADCKVSFKRALTGTNWDVGVLVRTNSTGTTGYFLDPIGTGPSNTMDLWRIDGPAMTNDAQVGTTVTGLTLVDGDTYALKVVTNTLTGNVDLTGYLNGAIVITATDSTGSKILTAGRTGIINWNNTNDFDDFMIEDLLTITPGPPSIIATTTRRIQG